jgi:regulator of protease activity HflC (stomatin/prohibitin superfamily)
MCFLGLFAINTGCQSVFTTDAGTVDIVLRWGVPTRVTEPGLNFKIPYVESDYTIETRERAYGVKLASASKDPMEVEVEITLNWAVNKDQVVQMYYQYGKLDQFEERIIKPRLPDAVKAVVSTFLVNDLLLQRNKLRDDAKAGVFKVIPQEIVTITGFAVTNVEFPKAYTKQIADVQVAREAANAQEQELRKQNFKAQEVFNSAKAQADATKARADAEAYEIAIKGKATLDVAERQGAILKANPLLVDWERAQKLVPGVLPHTFIGGDESAKLLFKLGDSDPRTKSK